MRTSVVQPLRRMTPWTVLLCLVILALALAACGGDSGSSSSGSSSSGSGSSASSGGSGMTVTIKESKDSSGKDQYSFDPTSITVKKGDKVTFDNKSDELQDIDGGDASQAGVDVKVPVGQTATATFDKTGTFTLKSEKGATITVTVN